MSTANSESDRPEDLARRKFLQSSIYLMMGIGVAIAAPPLAISFTGPSFREGQNSFVRVGPVSQIASGNPVSISFTSKTTDAYLSETNLQSVWVHKGKGDKLAVYSPICPHLGCQYNWDSQTENFHCPCHGSVFAADGKVLGGPAPRPLDTLPYQVTDGELFVKWERFKVGIPEKVQV